MNKKLEKAKRNLSEIVNLCKKEIQNNAEDITAILDLEDLKSLKTVMEALENSISKEKVEKQLQELKDMKVEGEIFATAVKFAIKNMEELLEGK